MNRTDVNNYLEILERISVENDVLSQSQILSNMEDTSSSVKTSTQGKL
jgi:hypothetical protein